MGRTPLHTVLAVVAAILTMVIVFAIERGTEWGLSGLSGLPLALVVLATIIPLGVVGLWTTVRELIEARKQRQGADLRGGAERDHAGE